jgi:hypothetical protein
MQIGDTQEPLVKDLGKRLRNSTTNPITLIYITSGSCTNIANFYNTPPTPNGGLITVNPKYIPSAIEDPAFTPTTTSPTCTIDPAFKAVDIANSNVFLEVCTTIPRPNDVGVYVGPVQGYAFVVPEGSSQTAITAEEAYFTFGFGNSGMVTPWNDEAFMFIRPSDKSTLQAMAANVAVPVAKWKGTRFDRSTQVVTAVASATNPEKAIGMLGVEVYDGSRSTLNALAYRAFRQKKAYYPDSTASATDKRNVRDGHYTLWSPTIYLTKVSGGVPVSSQAKYVIDLILGNTVTPAVDFNPLDVVISKGLVPECAMKVTRTAEGGNLSRFSPPQPCGCYYESRVATAPASCVACVDDTPCGTGKCRYNFCEAR